MNSIIEDDNNNDDEQKKMNGEFLFFRDKTNAEVYNYAFRKIFMRTLHGRKDVIIGNSQREQFVTVLDRLLTECYYGKRSLPIEVLDVGAGSGEIVDLIIHKLKRATISLVEPNKILLQNYVKRIGRYENLQRGDVHAGTLQSLWQDDAGITWFDNLQSPNLILAIHMIYHLTNFDDDDINPAQDIIDGFSSLYAKLAVGGSIFLVYAQQQESIVGKLTHIYFDSKMEQRKLSRNLSAIWKSRETYLNEKKLATILGARFPAYRCEMSSERTNSKIFVRDEKELAMVSIIGELGEYTDHPFDVCKLDFLHRMIKEKRSTLGIQVERNNGIRKGMLAADQPQIVCIITKSTLV